MYDRVNQTSKWLAYQSPKKQVNCQQCFTCRENKIDGYSQFIIFLMVGVEPHLMIKRHIKIFVCVELIFINHNLPATFSHLQSSFTCEKDTVEPLYCVNKHRCKEMLIPPIFSFVLIIELYIRIMSPKYSDLVKFNMLNPHRPSSLCFQVFWDNSRTCPSFYSTLPRWCSYICRICTSLLHVKNPLKYIKFTWCLPFGDEEFPQRQKAFERGNREVQGIKE